MGNPLERLIVARCKRGAERTPQRLLTRAMSEGAPKLRPADRRRGPSSSDSTLVNDVGGEIISENAEQRQPRYPIDSQDPDIAALMVYRSGRTGIRYACRGIPNWPLLHDRTSSVSELSRSPDKRGRREYSPSPVITPAAWKAALMTRILLRFWPQAAEIIVQFAIRKTPATAAGVFEKLRPGRITSFPSSLPSSRLSFPS